MAEATWNPTHFWIGRRFRPERRGEPCRLLIAHRGKYLLQFADGERTVTVRGTFRRIEVSNG